MGAEPYFGALLAEIKSARQGLASRDQRTIERVDELEASLNQILVGMRRPGADRGDDRDLERKSAIEMCEDRRSWSMQKSEGGRWLDYQPSRDEIEEAIGAQRSFKALLRSNGDFRRLEPIEQKNLSAFSFGNNGWAVPSEFSSRVLSCLVDPSDFLSLLPQATVSGASITYPLDNSELTADSVGWACEAACEGPVGSLPPPGQIELKPETLRCRICATGADCDVGGDELPRWHMHCHRPPDLWFDAAMTLLHEALGPAMARVTEGGLTTVN